MQAADGPWLHVISKKISRALGHEVIKIKIQKTEAESYLVLFQAAIASPLPRSAPVTRFLRYKVIPSFKTALIHFINNNNYM